MKSSLVSDMVFTQNFGLLSPSFLINFHHCRELLELKDGGVLCLDWLEDPAHTADQPIVIILHGLTGSSQSEYVKSFVLAVQEIGARCVVFNNRGLGGVQLKVSPLLIVTVMYQMVRHNRLSPV